MTRTWTPMRWTALIIGAVIAMGAQALEPGTLAVKVTGIRPDEGSKLDLMLYASAEAQENDEALQRLTAELGPGKTEHIFVLRDVPAGTYMVVGAQDKNGNDELDTNFLGIPKEGYFTSNDKRLPSWEKCSFDYDGEPKGIELKTIYW